MKFRIIWIILHTDVKWRLHGDKTAECDCGFVNIVHVLYIELWRSGNMNYLRYRVKCFLMYIEKWWCRLRGGGGGGGGGAALNILKYRLGGRGTFRDSPNRGPVKIWAFFKTSSSLRHNKLTNWKVLAVGVTKYNEFGDVFKIMQINPVN
jgi:hypothetical protein